MIKNLCVRVGVCVFVHACMCVSVFACVYVCVNGMLFIYFILDFVINYNY